MPQRIVILTEGHTEPHVGKTATSLVRYRTDEVVALLDSTRAGRTAQQCLGVGGDIPIAASLSEVAAADTLILGIAPQGGKIPSAWRPVLLEAIDRGMTIVSGLHDFLTDDAELTAAAAKKGVRLVDVRKNRERDVATRKGIRSGCLRIHTVGHDCSVGKMVTAIEVARGLRDAGHDAKFVATGQTGIMIEGDGCPIDCVVADFISGAAEKLVLANQHHDILLIEGQGTLIHPSYSGVTLGLLHGSMPDGLILCYEVGRTTVHNFSDLPMPPLATIRDVYEMMANLMHPCRVIGVAMNSRKLTEAEAAAERDRATWELGLPVCDVFRDGAGPLVEAVLKLKEEAQNLGS